MECGYSYLRLLLYADWQHINVCKNLIMSNMEVGSSLRWLSASTMTQMHHFDSTSDHVPQNLSQVRWLWLCMAAIICLETAYLLVKYFLMFKMEVGSSLRWLSASTLMEWHHFDSTSDPEPQNLTQVGWVYLCKAATVCQWTAYQFTQIIWICLIWRWEAVWGDRQPQPWHNHIILTPRVPQNSKFWAKK